MNFLVLGAGAISHAIVHDLLHSAGVENVFICDIAEDKLETMEACDSERIHTMVFNANDIHTFETLLNGIDCVISTLPVEHNYRLAKKTITLGCHFIGMNGNIRILKKHMQLHELAVDKGCCLIPDAGLAPGLTSIVSAEMLSRLDNATELHILCGSLPLRRDNPLCHNKVYSVHTLLEQYIEQCLSLHDGQILYTPALADVEAVHFPPSFPDLEAFPTSGGISAMPLTLKDHLQGISFKTLHYPGHHHMMKTLIELGFADDTLVQLGGKSFSRRSLFETLLESSLAATFEDVVLFRALLKGNGRFLQAELQKFYDIESGLSAFMICCGFPVSLLAQMCVKGEIGKSGYIYQERDIHPGEFLGRLAEKGIRFHFSSPQV